MFEMTEEEFNYCEEMERRKQEADRKEMEEEKKMNKKMELERFTTAQRTSLK